MIIHSMADPKTGSQAIMAELNRSGISVLHVTPSMANSFGGPSRSVGGLATALNHHGHSAMVFTTDVATPPQAREIRVSVSRQDITSSISFEQLSIHPVDRPWRLVRSRSLHQALRCQAREFDLIHIHSLFLFPQWYAYITASKNDLPWIVSPHGALDPYLRQRGTTRKGIVDWLWQRRMLDNAGAIHLTSSTEADQLQDLQFKSPSVVIPNGVDISWPGADGNAIRFRERFLDGTSAPIILNHGRIAGKKGLDLLVEALGGIPEAVLVLVGEDSEGLVDGLRTRALENGTSDRLFLTGGIQGQDLNDALVAADVWALPSHGENFGMAVVEAMGAGRAVITSAAVNIAPDAAEQGALVISDNDPPAIAGMIRELLADPARRARLGSAGSQYVKRFAWTSVIDEYVAMYERVLDARRGR